jgi:large subunit ribosomal protein L22
MPYKYTIQTTEKQAKAVGINLPISTKISGEICRAIRGKNTKKAKTILDNAISMKKAIPYTRFNDDIGHKPGMGPGRFPVKAAAQIKKMVESAEANARFKGMNADNLEIVSILAQKGPKTPRYGRQSRRLAKRTHIEIVLGEAKKEKEKARDKK